MRPSPTWDILIASIAHRTDMLTDLLAELKRQLVPGVGVLVYRDNRQQLYGPKCQRLYDASKADYVSMLDDDDWISEDYIQAVMEALREKPDYVGYKILYTEHGQPQIPIIHSLQYRGWVTRRRRCTGTSATTTRSAATWHCKPRGKGTGGRISLGRSRYGNSVA